MPIGLNNTDIEVDYGGGNIFNVDIPKYLLTTTTEVSGEEIPIVNKDVLTRTQYDTGSDVTNGLVAHYKFNNPNPLNDEKGNYPLTNSGTNVIFTSSEKVVGESSYFPASSDGTNHLSITNSFNPYTIWSGNGITFSWWMKLGSSQTYGRPFEFGSDSNNRITNYAYSGTNTITIRVAGSADLANIQLFPGNNGVGIWKHYVWSIDTSGVWSSYLNGVNQNISFTLNIPNISYTQARLGESLYGGPSDMLQGYIDDFRIYNKALSATEITDLYNLGAVNIEEGDISGTNDKYIAYKYIGGNDNGSGQTEYNLHFNNPALCDILVVAGGGAGGGNGQGGGGGAGALIYYEDIILQGNYTIKVGNGGTNGNTANVGDSGSDSEFKRTSDGKQQFLAKGGGGGGTLNSAGYLPGNGGSGGGGAGDSISGTIIDDSNIVNGIVINVITNTNVVEHYDITMFSGDRGVDSLNDVGCFGNNGGIEQFGGHDDWGAGGGGAGTKGSPTSESGGIQYAGDGGSGKKYNITGTEVYYAAGGGGGIKPDANSLNTAQVGAGGLGGGGAGGGGGTADSAVDSNGVNGEPHTGSGGGGVGASTAANYKGGDGGSGIIIIRYKDENINSDAYIPQGDNASQYTILDSDSTNLVAHYKFDEGEEYTDSASGFYNLIDLGITSLFSTDEKVFGKSAHESGTEAKIQFPDSIASQISELSSTTGITFSFWFNMNTSSGAWASLFEFSNKESDTTLTNRIGISKNNTTNNIWIGIKEDNVITSMTCGVVDNEWHHITWSIDNRGTWQVYFDGVNQYPNKFKQIPQIYNYDYSYLFGSVQSSQTNGYIDDFRIYNKVLNPLEIHYLANKSIKLVPIELDSEYSLLTFLYHNDLNSEDTLDYDFGAQSYYNLTFDNPTECDILIVGGGGAGGGGSGTGTGAGGGGGGQVQLIQSFQATAGSSYNVSVGKGGQGIFNTSYMTGSSGYNSSFDTYVSLGGGGGGVRNYSGSATYTGGGAGGYGGGAGDGTGYDGGLGGVSGAPAGQRGGGGGAGSGGDGGDYSGASGGYGGIGIDRVGDFIFSEKFGTSIGYLENGTTWFGGGGGGSGESGAGTNGVGRHGGTSGNNSTGISQSASWGGGSGGAVVLNANTDVDGDGSYDHKVGDGGSGIVLVKYKRNMGTPTITTTSKLAQWTYSSSDTSVYHSGNVGIGTFPVANYSLNVKGDINTTNLYKEGSLIGRGKIIDQDGLKEWKYSNSNTTTYFMGNVGIGVTNPSVALEVDGTILKKAGINFKIQHPLNHNKWLYHTGLEGPRYDNIYRGKKVISGGYGEINIDMECNSAGGMSSGTFVALNNNPFLYLRNNQTFDNVIGYIDNGIIKVNCENTSDDVEVEWMVIGERKDNAIKKSQLTDNQGRLLCERQL